MCDAFFAAQRVTNIAVTFICFKVMATDIFEKDMKATRNARWDKVFHSNIGSSLDDIEFTNMKATIVIEHIVSLLSHYMD